MNDRFQGVSLDCESGSGALRLFLEQQLKEQVWFQGSCVWPSLGSVVKYLPRALYTSMELVGADPFGLCSLCFLGLAVPVC